MEFMLLIIQGYASSYSIWSYMKDNPKEYPKPTAYKNINQRLLRLARIGLLEGEIKFDSPESTHGRRDYKITMEGLKRLIPYFLTYPESFKELIEYMNKSNLDKDAFGNVLVRNAGSLVRVVNEYYKHADLHKSFEGVFTPEGQAEMKELRKAAMKILKLERHLDELEKAQLGEEKYKKIAAARFNADVENQWIPEIVDIEELWLSILEIGTRMKNITEIYSKRARSADKRKTINEAAKKIDGSISLANKAFESFRHSAKEFHDNIYTLNLPISEAKQTMEDTELQINKISSDLKEKGTYTFDSELEEMIKFSEGVKSSPGRKKKQT
jgi:hypothetical protein